LIIPLLREEGEAPSKSGKEKPLTTSKNAWILITERQFSRPENPSEQSAILCNGVTKQTFVITGVGKLGRWWKKMRLVY